MNKKTAILLVISIMLIITAWIQITEIKRLQRMCDEIIFAEIVVCEEPIEPEVIHLDPKKEPVKTITEVETEAEKTRPKNTYIGTFKLTAYCSCRECCDEYADNRPIDEDGNEIVYGAIGEILTEGYSIAVDPKVIPYRTEVLIDGNVYRAQDCGGAIKGNRIDVYFNDHNRAKEFGVQYKDVYIIGDMGDGGCQKGGVSDA